MAIFTSAFNATGIYNSPRRLFGNYDPLLFPGIWVPTDGLVDPGSYHVYLGTGLSYDEGTNTASGTVTTVTYDQEGVVSGVTWSITGLSYDLADIELLLEDAVPLPLADHPTSNTFIFGSPADESTVGIYRVGHTDLIAADTANDTADYSAHTQALTISLDQTAGVAEGPSAGTDSLFGIEHAIGGSAADTMFGDALDNLLAGSQGNDTIRGADGADTIDGGADNDLIYGGPGADDIDGGGGIDTLDFSTDNADGGIAGAYVDLANDFAQDGFGDYDMIAGIERVIGTVEDRVIGALSDVLLGDENANSFSGLAGLDYIVGDGGNDTIDTGAGMAGTVGDIAVAGAGDDSVLGGSGATFVYGQDGSDDIFGGAGDDWLFGGDFFGVVSGVDLLVGEGGNDVLAVGSATGSAYMYGGAGDDIIYGGSTTPEADVLVGGTGDDFMYGGFGGADDYWFVTGDLAAGDFDQIYGFDSNDELIFSSSYSGQITAQQLTLNDVSGSYLSHASGWALWMPYTNVNTVLSQTVFSNGSPPV